MLEGSYSGLSLVSFDYLCSFLLSMPPSVLLSPFPLFFLFPSSLSFSLFFFFSLIFLSPIFIPPIHPMFYLFFFFKKNVLHKNRNFEGRFFFYLQSHSCLLLAKWPQASHLTSLCLTFLVVIVRETCNRSFLNWSPCDQFACWISMHHFCIQQNILCPLNTSSCSQYLGLSCLLHLLELYAHWASVITVPTC